LGTRALSLGAKRLKREVDHSPPSSAEARMRGVIHPLPKYAFMAWYSVKSKGTTLHLLLKRMGCHDVESSS